MTRQRNEIEDVYRVLPHSDIYFRIDGTITHKPCGMDLPESTVIEANWCPYCAATINKAAQLRSLAAIRSAE